MSWKPHKRKTHAQRLARRRMAHQGWLERHEQNAQPQQKRPMATKIDRRRNPGPPLALVGEVRRVLLRGFLIMSVLAWMVFMAELFLVAPDWSLTTTPASTHISPTASQLGAATIPSSGSCAPGESVDTHLPTLKSWLENCTVDWSNHLVM